jgi:hypothetical protein
MSLWLAISLYSLVSSANMYTSDSTFSGKSLINITNNTGPSTEPCGIPLVTLCHFDTDPFSCTLCLRLLRKFLTYTQVWLLIPYERSLLISLMCGTLSKAFIKSINGIDSSTIIEYSCLMVKYL